MLSGMEGEKCRVCFLRSEAHVLLLEESASTLNQVSSVLICLGCNRFASGVMVLFSLRLVTDTCKIAQRSASGLSSVNTMGGTALHKLGCLPITGLPHT